MKQVVRVSTVRRISWLFLTGTTILVAAAVSTSIALAQQAQPVTVTTTEFAFNPKTIPLRVGQPVQLVIRNTGSEDHNLSSDEIPISNVTYQQADNEPGELRDYEARNVLDADVRAGATARVTVTPTRGGTFEFHSGEGDDEEKGMVGTFTVLAPGALPNTGSDPRSDTLVWAAVLFGALLVAGGLVVRRHTGSRADAQ